MSIASILGLSGTAHGAFATRSATSTASEELQSLFSKLHMDAIASATAGTTASSGSSAGTATASTTSSSSTSAVTGLVHGLRHIFDGGLAVAKEARSAAKAATAYASGGGIGAVATQVLDKLA